MYKISGGLLLMASLMMGGSLASERIRECVIDRCEVYSPMKMFRENKWMPPTGEQLKVMCPLVSQFIECFNNSLKECSDKFTDLTAMETQLVTEISSVMVKLSKLVNVICDEDTELHKNYVENVACFTEMIQAMDNSCSHQGTQAYDGFKDSLNQIESEDTGYRSERRCIVTVYTIACFSINVQKTCGEAARHTFVEILKILSVIKEGCSDAHTLILKNEFLDSLNLEEEPRSLFYDVFDSKRK